MISTLFFTKKKKLIKVSYTTLKLVVPQRLLNESREDSLKTDI
jgi:hypothetical protein